MRCSTIWVGADRGRAWLYWASRFLRGFFSSAFAFFAFAFTKLGVGVFCLSSSAIRSCALRNSSCVACNCSNASFSCFVRCSICSCAVMARVYQQRVNLNSLLFHTKSCGDAISTGDRISTLLLLFHRLPHRRKQYYITN